MLTRREMIATLGVLAAAVPAFAADATLTGEMVCAKCYLKKPDAKECQDILLVSDATGTAEFYITKNKVATDAGEACTEKVPATVTGTISEHNGRKWITASKIVRGKAQ